MFNDLNASSPEGTKEVDDIFSDVDKTPTPAAMPTFSGSQSPAQNSVPNQVFPGAGKEAYLNVEDNMPAAGERGTKFLKMVLILVVVAAIVSVAGYFVYTQFIEPEKKTNTPNNTPIVVDSNNPEDIQNMEEIINQQENNLATTSDDLLNEVPTTTDVVELVDPLNPANPANPEMEPISNEPISIEEPLEATVDTDGDGLSDQEEALFGTDINSVDTDGDGLSDYEEVKTYLTNPLNADTDGDTYPDGSEVEKGYNPNGEGKLEVKV